MGGRGEADKGMPSFMPLVTTENSVLLISKVLTWGRRGGTKGKLVQHA